MKTSIAYKRLQESITPDQVQNLLNNNSLYKVYIQLGVSEPLLLRYINDYGLSFKKAFKTLSDFSEVEKNQMLLDWTSTNMSKKELRKKYSIGPKALNRFLRDNNVNDRKVASVNLQFLEYQKLVRKLTNVVIRHYNLTTQPGYDWDHKFSVFEGFYQNIHPSIIASRENLELIPSTSNRSNGRSCSITRDALIKQVCG